MLNLNPILAAANGPAPATQATTSPQPGTSDGDRGDSSFGKTLDTARKNASERDNSADKAPNSEVRAQQNEDHRERHGEHKTDAHRESRKPRHDTTQPAEEAAAALPLLTATPTQGRQNPATTTGNLLPTTTASAQVTSNAAPIEIGGTLNTMTSNAGNARTMPEGSNATFSAPLAREVDASASDALAGNEIDATQRLIDASRSALSAASPMQMAPIQHSPTPAIHQLTVQTSPQSPVFAQDIGQHVVWLSNQQVQEARIQLHPRDLGPVHVNVQVHHDRVDVSFAAQHPDTVHALQQTLPQLDALLARHGLSLGQAHVGQQQSGHHGGQTPADHAGPGAGASEEQAGGTEGVSSAPTSIAVGLVDAFA